MTEIIYSKAAPGRDRKYKIITQFEKNESEIIVRKRALTEESEKHIKKMAGNFPKLKSIWEDSDMSVTACRVSDDTSVVFPYIAGENLEALIERYLSSGRQAEAVKQIKRFLAMFLNNRHIERFSESEKFKTVFGIHDIWKDELSLPVTNADSVFTNFIVDSGRFVMIDYEWVFEFPVPVRFVIYRTLLHSFAFQRLGQQWKEEVYRYAGMREEDFPAYLEVEKCFQHYVQGRHADPEMFYKAVGTHSWIVNREKPWEGSNGYEIYFDGRLEDRADTVQNHINIQAFVPSGIHIVKILLNRFNGVYKLCGVWAQKHGERIPVDTFAANADLVICDDYYFNELPEITVKNDDYQMICIEYLVIEKNCNCMQQMTTALRDAEKYRLAGLESEKEARSYKEKMEEYQQAYWTLEDRVMEYQQAYRMLKAKLEQCQKDSQAQQEELSEIKNTWIWRLYSRAKRLRGEK